MVFSVQDKKSTGAVAQNGQLVLVLTATFLCDLARPLWTGLTVVVHKTTLKSVFDIIYFNQIYTVLDTYGTSSFGTQIIWYAKLQAHNAI